MTDGAEACELRSSAKWKSRSETGLWQGAGGNIKDKRQKSKRCVNPERIVADKDKSKPGSDLHDLYDSFYIVHVADPAAGPKSLK